MKRRYLNIFIFIVLPVTLFSGDLWDIARDDNGITVYQRSDKTTGDEQFLAITTVDAGSEKILAVVKDINSNRYWMADCIYSEMKLQVSDSEFIAYYVTKPPWPVEKRDSVVRIRIKRISRYNILIEMNSLPEGEAGRYVSKVPDMVRIYRMNGFVGLTENSGKTEVRFGVSGEAGGDVPGFIVRWGGWRIPYSTLDGLRNFVLFDNRQK